MPINKYDQAAQAQFMNTYVPIPFEEMVMAGKQKQDRYDRAAGAVDSAIAAAEDITAIPFSADEIRAKDYVAKMRDIRDRYAAKDISDPFVLREMSNELHRSVNKEDIKHIQQSYQGYLSYQKQLAENEQRGTPTPDWARQRFEGYDSSSPQGVFTGNARAQLDPYKDTSDFMKQMGMTRKEDVDLAPGVRAIKYSKDASEITKHAKDNLEAFMTLPSIRQYINGIKANGGADGRTDEQIALDFVEKNKRQWQEERLDPYNYDTSLVGGGPGSNPNPTHEPEINQPKGVPAETKPVKERKIVQEMEALKAAEEAGDQDASNKLDAVYNLFKTVEDNPLKGEKITQKEKIEVFRQEGDVAFKAAMEALTSGKIGMSNDEAFKYLVENSAKSETGIAESGDVRKGRLKNLIATAGEKTAKSVLLNPVNLNVMFPATPSQPRSADIKERQEYVKNINDYFISLKDGNSKEQILTEYYKHSNKLEKSIKKEEDLLEKAKADAYNGMKPYQETYTVLNGMFKQKNGVFEGVYKDDKGNEKTYPSYIGKHTSDVLFNQKNYPTNFYDEDGKEISTKKKNNIHTILGKYKNFMITGVDNKPTESGGVKVTVHMMDDKDAPVGDKFQVELPLRQGDNMENFVREMLGRDQEKTVFNQLNYGLVESLVKSAKVYNGGQIPLTSLSNKATEEDFIYFEPHGAGLIPILYFDGKETRLSEEPVSYNNLPSYLTGVLQSIKMD